MTILTTLQYSEAILTRAYHRLPAADMARSLRADLDACPKRAWSELQPGETYLFERCRGSQETVRLLSITPAHGQAHVLRRSPRDGSESPDKLYRGAYGHALAIELSPPLILLLGVSHRDVLETALAGGHLAEIPGAVRREEPDLFVAIPERFSTEAMSRANKGTGTERLRLTLSPRWNAPVTVSTLEESIDDLHARIAEFQEERAQATRLNPRVEGDYGRYIADAKESIDWFRWVQTLVEEEGVFEIVS